MSDVDDALAVGIVEAARQAVPAQSAPAVDGGHRFTISEAAEACGVSRDTIKRRRAAGNFGGAAQDESGTWTIPLSDLLADGLHPHAPGTDGGEPQGVAPPPAPLPPSAAEELARWRALAEERERVIAAQERTITALETAMRALGPGPGQSPPTPPPQPVSTVSTPDAGDVPPRRRWWRRG